MICERHFLQNTCFVLQNVDHVVDIVDGVVVNNDQWSEVWWRTWNECQQWSTWVDGEWKLVGSYDDMEKV
jgi:hypothetical protein